ncbi:unnamed protein product [Lota lota]
MAASQGANMAMEEGLVEGKGMGTGMTMDMAGMTMVTAMDTTMVTGMDTTMVTAMDTAMVTSTSLVTTTPTVTRKERKVTSLPAAPAAATLTRSSETADTWLTILWSLNTPPVAIMDVGRVNKNSKYFIIN